MFWLRNKNNNFQLRTLIWGPDSCTLLTLCILVSDSQMCTLANSEDPDEMLHKAIQRKKYLEFLTCDPRIYKMDHPKFYASSQKEESISA